MSDFAYHLTRDRADAADLYQETILRAIKKLDQFKSETNLKAWLIVIMRNTFINAYRKKRRRKTLLDGSINQYLIDVTPASTNNHGEWKVDYDELLAMIDRLEESLRIPFLLAYEGYKYDEIAGEMGVPVGTIKSRVFFARKKLQKALRQNHAIPDGKGLYAA